MMLAARTAMWGSAGWKNPYITDGLVAMWDVLASPPTASTWAATVGDGIDWALTGTSIDSDGGLKFSGNVSSFGQLDAEQSAIFPRSGDATLEVVCKTTQSSGYGGVIIKTPSDCTIGMAMFTFFDFSNNIVGPVYGVYDRNAIVGWGCVYSNNIVSTPYRNGVSISTATTDNIGGSQTVTTIGKRMSGSHNFFGNIYAIRLYSRALTASEIAANYAVDAERFNLA